jgi:cytochrome c553
MNRSLNMKRNAPRLIPAMIAVLLAAPAFAGGNVAAGETKAAVCAACHGAAGNAPITPDYPRLAGQHEDYLVNALHDYQKGGRKNPIMAAQAQALSAQDIQDLAVYFAAQPSNLSFKY